MAGNLEFTTPAAWDWITIRLVTLPTAMSDSDRKCRSRTVITDLNYALYRKSVTFRQSYVYTHCKILIEPTIIELRGRYSMVRYDYDYCDRYRISVFECVCVFLEHRPIWCFYDIFLRLKLTSFYAFVYKTRRVCCLYKTCRKFNRNRVRTGCTANNLLLRQLIFASTTNCSIG